MNTLYTVHSKSLLNDLDIDLYFQENLSYLRAPLEKRRNGVKVTSHRKSSSPWLQEGRGRE